MSSTSILLVGNYSTKTGYAWNNIYRLFNVIARAMHLRGVSVCLLFSELELPVDFIDTDIPFNSFEFDQQNITLSALYALAKEIRQQNIRYVYFTDKPAFSLFYLFLRCVGVQKIIIHSRVSVADPFPARPERGLRRVVKTAIGKIDLLTPDRIYAVSNFVRDRLVLKNCVPEDKVVVILNGINLESFEYDGDDGGTGAVRIFAGARANKYKGILSLIHAADLLVDRHKITNFIIEYAGDGPDLEQFKGVVKEKSLERHFIFLGVLDGTRDAVCKADIVVVPSSWGDACPSSVSEALAAGKPLITTSAGGIPEMVGDESNAILISPSDEEALASELADLITNEKRRKSLGANARARAEDALDEKAYYNTVIKQLMTDLF